MKTKLSSTGRLVFLLLCGIIPLFASSQQIPNSLTAANGTFIGFWEYKPVDYAANPNEKYPLIVFLHGIGERGDGTTQLPMVLANAIPKYIANGHPMRFFYNGKWETFLVLSPQLAPNMGHWPPFYVEEMIRYARNNMRIDTNRIYVTGVSLGGGGTWEYASSSYENAKQVAAITTVCGTCNWGNVCGTIAAANLPVWSFHASDDGLVGYGCTTGAVGMINSCNPGLAQMSIYPTGNHWIWDMSYDTAHNFHNPNMYEWFLSKSRAGSAPGPNQPPVARAGTDQSITLPVNAVTLNGTASSDPDGTINAFAWVKIGGPAQHTIVSPNGSTTVINNLAQGVYSFQLTVTDNLGATARDTVLVTVNGAAPVPNQPPAAIAGPDQVITIPTSNTYLFGSGSYDPDGIITGFAWSQLNGPAAATINPLGPTNVDVSNLVQGVYNFRLVVTDNQGATSSDTVRVTVLSTNMPPVANAGTDQSIQLPASSATLNGSGSNDPDGNITTYAWTKIAGPAQFNLSNANTANATAGNLAAGTYSFRLIVTDNRGATDDDTVNVTVALPPPPPNVAPTANAGVDQSIQLPTNNITLNGSASTDPDGTISSYAWSKVAGPAQYNITNANTVSASITNLVAGTYSFRLVVTDNNGAADDDTVLITVAPAPPPPNVAPTANAGADQSIQLPANSVTLDGAASSDADGSITNYAWTKIAGPTQYNISNANTVNPSVTNLAAGNYLFLLVVTDNNGATDADTVAVNVGAAPPPPNVPPTARAGNDQSIQLPANSVTLNGAASTDVDGTITAYAWSKLSGPAQYTIANANNVSTGVTGLVAGSYSFRLVVTDNNGATGSDTVVINVAPAPLNVPPVANAGNDQWIQLPANSVNLTGAASGDADGTISGYAWSKISGPAQFNITNANNVNTSVSNLAAGTYAFRLVVTDNNGAADDDTVIVTVAPAPPPPNIPPVANAGSDHAVQLPANIASLDGTASSDADGNIVSYAWTRISGPAQYSIGNAANASTIVNNLVEGTYSFRLVVTDDRGASDDDTVVIIVSAAPPPPNVAPVAKAGNDVVIQLPSSSTTLNGSASYDPDGVISSYSWNRISGPAGITIVNATTSTADVVGMQAGEYIFELTVTDNNGATASDRVKVTVIVQQNIPPVAKAGNDTTIAFPASTAWLNGGHSGDADGAIVDFKWRQISGPFGASIQAPAAVTTMANNLKVGDCVFELTVTDNRGAVSKDSVTVSVVNNFRFEESLVIYPNPVRGKAFIRCTSDSTGELSLRILDINGRYLREIRMFKGQSSFEDVIMLTDLKPGTYYLEAVIGNKKRMIRKFIKQ
jgi:hypothetical protein